MTGFESPSHLRLAADLFQSYVHRRPKLPFLAKGEAGHGRGYVIDRIIESNGFTPYWLEEPTPAPDDDLDDHRFFPVYELAKNKLKPDDLKELTSPCALLVPPDFYAGKDLNKKLEAAYFTPPCEADIEQFLALRGYPEVLANGNPSYGAALMAMRAWDAAQVTITTELPHPLGWDDFRSGGQPPVDGFLLGYYCAENLPRNYSWWNRLLSLQREVPARLIQHGWDDVRTRWSATTPSFPRLLNVKKPGRGRSLPEIPVSQTPEVRDLPPIPKRYHVDLD